MGWYRVDVTRHTHRKIRRLARLLGVHMMHAVGIHDTMISIVTDAGLADGAIGGFTARELAEDVEWDGDPETLLAALIESRLIDRTETGLMVHGFAEHLGSMRELQEQKRRDVKAGIRTAKSSVASFVYFIQCEVTRQVKIGRATCVMARLSELQGGSPGRLDLFATVPDGDREREFHARFAHLRIRGEWFAPAPELLSFIASIQAETETHR